jgi:hypothetical protein
VSLAEIEKVDALPPKELTNWQRTSRGAISSLETKS